MEVDMEPAAAALLASPAHHEPEGSIDKLYHRGQLEGRINVLSQVLFKIGDDTHAQAIKAEAVNYLKSPASHFVELTLPPSTPGFEKNFLDNVSKSAKSALQPEAAKPKPNDLCVRLQETIQHILDKHSGYNLESLFRIDEDTDDPYVHQGMYDCLHPLIFRAVKRPTYGFPLPDKLPEAFSKLVFDITMEAKVAHHGNSNIQKLVLYGGIKDVKAVDELKILNNTLPQFKKVPTIEFTNRLNTFSWTSGHGIGFLIDALIAMPRLKCMIFKDLQTPIDKQSALALAKVVLAKEKKEGSSPIQELSFRSSISYEGLFALIHALKDYKSPLTLTLQFGSSFDVQKLVHELGLKHSSYRVNNDFLHIQFPILTEANA